MSLVKYLEMLVIVQLFFSFGITGIIYALPPQYRTVVYPYDQVEDSLTPSQITAGIDQSTTRQSQFSVVEVATLAIYSGNMFIDLIFNFIFAVPLMAELVLKSIFQFIVVDPVLLNNLRIFILGVLVIGYVTGIIAFFTQTRSQSTLI